MISLKWLIALVALVCYAIREVRRYWALRHFNGPPLSGFTRYWLFKANTSGRLHEYYTEWNDKYGSTFRISPKCLLTRDVAVIKRINAVRSDYSRGDWYRAVRLHPTQDNVTTYQDDKTHTKVRQALAPGVSSPPNQHSYITDSLVLWQKQYTPGNDIDSTLLKLINLIQNKYLSPPSEYVSFDLAQTATFFTLDTISTVAFGRCFGFLDKDGDPFDYIKQGRTLWPFVQYLATFPEIDNLLRIPSIRALWPSASDATGLGAVMNFAHEVVASRFHPKDPPTTTRNDDMLSSFIAHGLSQTQLESETLIQITAGSDSTATAIRMALLHITTNPRILATLRAELDAEARAMPYLQACIREALRIVPPVAGLLPKKTPPGAGDVLADKYVPPGTEVGWNVWGVMHDRATFGADADVFRPERWLDTADEAKVARMVEAQGVVFGAGKHGCLGRGVAMLELDKAVAELLMRFEWEVADAKKPFKSVCLGFFLQEDMFFRVTERKEGGVVDEGLAERARREGLGLQGGKRDFGMETQWEDL